MCDEVLSESEASLLALYLLEDVGVEHEVEKGICLLVKDMKLNKLSLKQREIFDRLISKYCTKHCDVCGKQLTPEELYNGICECEVRYQNFMNKD